MKSVKKYQVMLTEEQQTTRIEGHDAIDSYFECITACSLDEEGVECVTRCVDIHLKEEFE